MPGNHWCDEDQFLAKKLHSEGKTLAEVARAVGRSTKAVQHKLKLYYPTKGTKTGRPFHFADITHVRPSALALMERDERMAIEPSSLTALICGDPLPGYSALDRR